MSRSLLRPQRALREISKGPLRICPLSFHRTHFATLASIESEDALSLLVASSPIDWIALDSYISRVEEEDAAKIVDKGLDNAVEATFRIFKDSLLSTSGQQGAAAKIIFTLTKKVDGFGSALVAAGDPVLTSELVTLLGCDRPAVQSTAAAAIEMLVRKVPEYGTSIVGAHSDSLTMVFLKVLASAEVASPCNNFLHLMNSLIQKESFYGESLVNFHGPALITVLNQLLLPPTSLETRSNAIALVTLLASISSSFVSKYLAGNSSISSALCSLLSDEDISKRTQAVYALWVISDQAHQLGQLPNMFLREKQLAASLVDMLSIGHEESQIMVLIVLSLLVHRLDGFGALVVEDRHKDLASSLMKVLLSAEGGNRAKISALLAVSVLVENVKKFGQVLVEAHSSDLSSELLKLLLTANCGGGAELYSVSDAALSAIASLVRISTTFSAMLAASSQKTELASCIATLLIKNGFTAESDSYYAHKCAMRLFFFAASRDLEWQALALEKPLLSSLVTLLSGCSQDESNGDETLTMQLTVFNKILVNLPHSGSILVESHGAELASALLKVLKDKDEPQSWVQVTSLILNLSKLSPNYGNFLLEAHGFTKKLLLLMRGDSPNSPTAFQILNSLVKTVDGYGKMLLRDFSYDFFTSFSVSNSSVDDKILPLLVDIVKGDYSVFSGALIDFLSNNKNMSLVLNIIPTLLSSALSQLPLSSSFWLMQIPSSKTLSVTAAIDRNKLIEAHEPQLSAYLVNMLQEGNQVDRQTAVFVLSTLADKVDGYASSLAAAHGKTISLPLTRMLSASSSREHNVERLILLLVQKVDAFKVLLAEPSQINTLFSTLIEISEIDRPKGIVSNAEKIIDSLAPVCEDELLSLAAHFLASKNDKEIFKAVRILCSIFNGKSPLNRAEFVTCLLADHQNELISAMIKILMSGADSSKIGAMPLISSLVKSSADFALALIGSNNTDAKNPSNKNDTISNLMKMLSSDTPATKISALSLLCSLLNKFSKFLAPVAEGQKKKLSSSLAFLLTLDGSRTQAAEAISLLARRDKNFAQFLVSTQFIPLARGIINILVVSDFDKKNFALDAGDALDTATAGDFWSRVAKVYGSQMGETVLKLITHKKKLHDGFFEELSLPQIVRFVTRLSDDREKYKLAILKTLEVVCQDEDVTTHLEEEKFLPALANGLIKMIKSDNTEIKKCATKLFSSLMDYNEAFCEYITEDRAEEVWSVFISLLKCDTLPRSDILFTLSSIIDVDVEKIDENLEEIFDVCVKVLKEENPHQQSILFVSSVFENSDKFRNVCLERIPDIVQNCLRIGMLNDIDSSNRNFMLQVFCIICRDASDYTEKLFGIIDKIELSELCVQVIKNSENAASVGIGAILMSLLFKQNEGFDKWFEEKYGAQLTKKIKSLSTKLEKEEKNK